MQQRGFIRKEEGFTLVEIVAVLVLLGILAAVAIPRYYSILDQARTSAAQGAIAEMKGQASQAYAKVCVANTGANPAIDSIMAEMTTNIGADFGVAIASGTGNTIVITVSTVQGKGLSPPVIGTWERPETIKVIEKSVSPSILTRGG